VLVLRGEFGLAKKPRPTFGCPSVNHHITIKNPACYDLDPYIGRYCEYTSIDEPDKPLAYAGHIERDSRGEAMVHDSGEDWVYAYTGVISEIKIYM
jgi:hypothetical protein